MSGAETRIRALPIWTGSVTLTPLKGGLSNASFIVADATGKYVARVGEDYPCHQVSREREAMASRAAFEAGLSPEVIHTAPGLMVSRFLDARTFSEEDMRVNVEACVDLVKRCHHDMGRRIRGQAAMFWVFQILRDYAHTLTEGRHRHAADLPRWMAAVDRFEDVQVPLPIIFGHHDLLPPNFMDDGRRLWLIDWEYGAFGTAMFDLANIATNGSFDAAGEAVILESYFERAPGEEVWRAFHAMKAASALREAMWGMVSELHLRIRGIDYAAHAAEYLARFERAYAMYVSNHGPS